MNKFPSKTQKALQKLTSHNSEIDSRKEKLELFSGQQITYVDKIDEFVKDFTDLHLKDVKIKLENELKLATEYPEKQKQIIEELIKVTSLETLFTDYQIKYNEYIIKQKQLEYEKIQNILTELPTFKSDEEIETYAKEHDQSMGDIQALISAREEDEEDLKEFLSSIEDLRREIGEYSDLQLKHSLDLKLLNEQHELAVQKIKPKGAQAA